jgi:flavin-dependent dehydrogenase
MSDHDVIIVGSGPAGSACAKALLDEGIDAFVLEKDKLPRYKCCSGVLFGQTQELLRQYFGVEAPPEVYCANDKFIRAADIREWKRGIGYIPYCWEIPKDGRSFSTDFGNIWRNLFDKWLLDISGAEYLEGARVNGFEVREDHIEVRVVDTDGDDTTSYRCQYLVGADGGNSIVRRGLKVASDRRLPSIASVGILQSYFKLKSLGRLRQGAWTVFFEPDIGEMLSCVHQKDDYLLLCVGGIKGRKLRDSVAKFRKMLADDFDVELGEWWRDEACQMALAPPYLGTARILLTGEAAGFIYLNGEGISAAIDSGYRSGRAIGRALREGGDAVKMYEESSVDIIEHMKKCHAQIHFLSV